MYNAFAKYYDLLMSDADYVKRTDYILSLFDEYGGRPALLLDLACGTGGFSNEFAKRGISVIGVDISEDMLSLAQEKSAAAGCDVLYVCQPAQSLDLYGTVDGAVCMLDSLNHITDYKEFCEAFIKVSLFLEKGSLFVFDLNTVYKHQKVLADNAFVLEEGDVFCAWQNFYSHETHTTEIFLDFFENSGGKYVRSSESFSERAYTDGEIAAALSGAGLKTEAVLGDMSHSAPGEDESRVIYVTRKI